MRYKRLKKFFVHDYQKRKENRSWIEDLRNTNIFLSLASERSDKREAISFFIAYALLVVFYSYSLDCFSYENQKRTSLGTARLLLCLSLFSFNNFIVRDSERFHPVSVLPPLLSG